MDIVLAYESGLPIYEQIKEQIKLAILSGELKENDPLPSLRQLARDLKVSVMTTTRAYSDLEAEGFVHTIPKKGVYVNKLDDTDMREHYMTETKKALLEARKQGKRAGLNLEKLHQLLDELEE